MAHARWCERYPWLEQMFHFGGETSFHVIDHVEGEEGIVGRSGVERLTILSVKRNDEDILRIAAEIMRENRKLTDWILLNEKGESIATVLHEIPSDILFLFAATKYLIVCNYIYKDELVLIEIE